MSKVRKFPSTSWKYGEDRDDYPFKISLDDRVVNIEARWRECTSGVVCLPIPLVGIDAVRAARDILDEAVKLMEGE